MRILYALSNLKHSLFSRSVVGSEYVDCYVESTSDHTSTGLISINALLLLAVE
jgi:hypothetical protein